MEITSNNAYSSFENADLWLNPIHFNLSDAKEIKKAFPERGRMTLNRTRTNEFSIDGISLLKMERNKRDNNNQEIKSRNFIYKTTNDNHLNQTNNALPMLADYSKFHKIKFWALFIWNWYINFKFMKQ